MVDSSHSVLFSDFSDIDDSINQIDQTAIFAPSENIDLNAISGNLYSRPFTPAKTPSSRPFTPLPPPADYIRPLSAPEIPAKFSIYASVDEALKGTEALTSGDDGMIEGINGRRSSNFVVYVTSLSSMAAVKTFVDSIYAHADEIFGLYFNGMIFGSDPSTCIEELLNAVVEFSKLKYLVDLDASYLPIPYSSLYSLCRTLDTRLSGYCPIKRLVLTRCNLNSKGVIAIFEALRGNIFVEEVIVNGNNCTDDAMFAVAACLGYNQNSIVEIGLASNGLTAKGIETLNTVLPQQRHLKQLQLQNNPQIGDHGIDRLITSIRDNKVLHTLNISNTGVKTCPWASRLQIMEALTTLDLSYNQIDDYGFRSLCDALENCYSLRHLDLSSNLFNGKLCMALGPALTSNKGLMDLNLSSNKITVPGVWTAIQCGLIANSTLLHLDISQCELRVEEAEIVCAAFSENEVCTIKMDLNPLPIALMKDPRSFTFAGSALGKPNKPLSPDAQLISIRSSKDWIDHHKAQVELGREASGIVASLINDPKYDRQEDANILPVIAMQKKFAEERDLADYNTELYGSGEKVVTIGYGSDMEIIGELAIVDSTTYHDIKEKIKPLVRSYLSFSKHKIVADLIENFSVLDHHRVPVIGRAAMVRTVWVDASLVDCCVIIRPADFMTLPDVEEEVRDENTQF